jgi:hypothetical protein
MADDKQPKKRGRKPKKQAMLLSNDIIKKDSEEEPLIAHLDLKLDDIELSEIEDSSEVDDSLFLKNTNDITNHIESELNLQSENKDSKLVVKSSREEKIDEIENKIFELKFELHKLMKNSSINIEKSKFSKNTKCWWCKNNFKTESVSLPECYFEDKFYCYGNFCSYNCAHSFNLDTNDNVWKKNSLLHLMYFKTYKTNVNIVQAPHWSLLKDFGGSLTIEQFRKKSIINTNDYLLLKPPMDSRMNFFEKTVKLNNTMFSNTMYQKLLDDTDDLVIKRSKPLKSSNYSLDNTMFIKKKGLIPKMNEVKHAFI